MVVRTAVVRACVRTAGDRRWSAAVTATSLQWWTEDPTWPHRGDQFPPCTVAVWLVHRDHPLPDHGPYVAAAAPRRAPRRQRVCSDRRSRSCLPRRNDQPERLRRSGARLAQAGVFADTSEPRQAAEHSRSGFAQVLTAFLHWAATRIMFRQRLGCGRGFAQAALRWRSRLRLSTTTKSGNPAGPSSCTRDEPRRRKEIRIDRGTRSRCRGEMVGAAARQGAEAASRMRRSAPAMMSRTWCTTSWIHRDRCNAQLHQLLGVLGSV